MPYRTALFFTAVLLCTSVTAQPTAFRAGTRTQGECTAWDQGAKAEAVGACTVDVAVRSPRSTGPVHLAVFHAGRVFRLAVLPDGRCTIDGTPCTIEYDPPNDRISAVIDSGRGLEFPAPR